MAGVLYTDADGSDLELDRWKEISPPSAASLFRQRTPRFLRSSSECISRLGLRASLPARARCCPGRGGGIPALVRFTSGARRFSLFQQPFSRSCAGRRLPLVHLGSCFLRVRMARSVGTSITLAALGEATHRRNELVLSHHADRILRGQWKTVAGVEEPSRVHLLAPACGNRFTADCPGALLTPFVKAHRLDRREGAKEVGINGGDFD